MKPIPFTAVFICSVMLWSCEDEKIELKPISPDLKESSVLSNRAQLGRVLFYDKQLSFNNSVSCASCHKQVFAFADNKAFSIGLEDKRTTRNSMPIQDLGGGNLRFTEDVIFTDDLSSSSSFFPGSSRALFWDGRESDLSSLILQPVTNHIEMGIKDLGKLREKIESIGYYQTLFEDAYGTSEVENWQISDAMTNFISHINSSNSKFQKSLFGTDTLSALEQDGFDFFTNKFDCNNCHQVQFSDGYLLAGTFANIGLDGVYEDKGRMEITGESGDDGLFKIPSLRNAAVTAPYMHDGRFETLEEVIDFYSNGIQDNVNLDTRLRSSTGDAVENNISDYEKTAIIAFLHTLTDHEMLTNPNFSNPFN